jgi:hypothetical protein
MGYEFHKVSKAGLIDRIKYENYTIKEWSLVGNHLWGLYPAVTNTDTFKQGDLIIHLFLLSGNRGEWGYKIMSESSHPYYYTCPIKFLKKAVSLSDAWRFKVLEHHASKPVKKSFNVGDVIELKNCNVGRVRVSSVKPLVGIADNGISYRITPRFIA